jgi:outer membrane protein assembly factor BamD
MVRPLMRPLLRARTLLLLPLLALAACASSRVSFTGQLRYGKNAEENYNAGVDELAHDNFVEAGKFLEHVKTKYPFSKYAALAELRLADSKFVQERYPEAAEAYQGFVNLHPNHDEADYAAFRVGLSRYNDAPVDFFLFPPAYEKDQKELRVAVEQFEAFVKERPNSKYAPEVKRLLGLSLGRLAAHELYVGDFYYQRERWAGAAGRYERLVKDYPGSPHEAEVLFRMARSYAELEERFRAKQALQKLLARYPQSSHRSEAEKMLERLR